MEWIELGVLAEINNGYAFKSKKYRDAGIRIIRITNVQKGYIEDSDPKFYSLEDMEDLDRFYLGENDILISLTGNVGRVARVTKEILPAALNQRVANIKPKKIINNNYLFYMMNSNKFENICINESKGVAQKNLGTTSLSKIKIPVPPINIQKQIVEVLDKAQSLIDNRKEQINLLDDLIESVFYDMFGDPVRNDKGWEVKKLGGLTSKIGSGATPRGGNSAYKEEGMSLIRSMNVYDGKFHDKGLAFIDDEQASKLDNVEVLGGDILINITGASINRSCIVPKSILPARVNQHVSILRVKEDLNNCYLLNLLISIKFKRKLYNIATSGGATREAITKADLENLEILVPSIDLQKQFAKKVEQIESQKQLLEESLKLLEDNYNSLIQRAFKGQLF